MSSRIVKVTEAAEEKKEKIVNMRIQSRTIEKVIEVLQKRTRQTDRRTDSIDTADGFPRIQ